MSVRIPLLILALLLGGCSKNHPGASFKPTELPELSPGERVTPGVLLSKVAVPTKDGSKNIWVYLPENHKGKLSVVLIAPAGTPLFHGMTLGEGDMPEHLPYVRSGFAVVAYEIDGPVSESAGDAETISGARIFQKANAGINNGKLALDYALARLPIDPQKVYSAGHSSAGTLALQFAQNDPRIKGCVAFAPVSDIPKRLGKEGVEILESNISGYGAFLKDVSPVAHIDRLKCPVFLFHALDDTNVPVSEAEEFAGQLKARGVDVTFETVPTGGHYDSMIEAGIPKAMEWLKVRT